MLQAKDGPLLTWDEKELLCLMQVDSAARHWRGSPLWALARDLNKEVDDVRVMIRRLRKVGVRVTMLPNDRCYIPLVVFRRIRPQLEAHDREFGPKNEFGFSPPRSYQGPKAFRRPSEYSDRTDFELRSDRRWRPNTFSESTRRYNG